MRHNTGTSKGQDLEASLSSSAETFDSTLDTWIVSPDLRNLLQRRSPRWSECQDLLLSPTQNRIHPPCSRLLHLDLACHPRTANHQSRNMQKHYSMSGQTFCLFPPDENKSHGIDLLGDKTVDIPGCFSPLICNRNGRNYQFQECSIRTL